MIYTDRLDKAIRIAAWAHGKQQQYRKGTDIPFIVHPFGTMLIASSATNDEDVLIACLLHDILEDVDATIYNQPAMLADFGDQVVKIVQDVTNNATLSSWHEVATAYLNHLEHKAGDQAVIVSTADKIHNIKSTITDYKTHGNKIWQRFSTKNSADQLWWYQAVLRVVTLRGGPVILTSQLADQIKILKDMLLLNEA
jgi:(p)ppGpp synthase/HD superfamily hydrolase